MSMVAMEGVTVEGGGVPIRIDGELIGGIGVSGAAHWQEDVDIIAVVFKKSWYRSAGGYLSGAAAREKAGRPRRRR